MGGCNSVQSDAHCPGLFNPLARGVYCPGMFIVMSVIYYCQELASHWSTCRKNAWNRIQVSKPFKSPSSVKCLYTGVGSSMISSWPNILLWNFQKFIALDSALAVWHKHTFSGKLRASASSVGRDVALANITTVTVNQVASLDISHAQQHSSYPDYSHAPDDQLDHSLLNQCDRYYQSKLCAAVLEHWSSQ